MSSPDPSAHKRISRGVHKFDNAVWDSVREDAVIAGNFAKFSHNPTVKHHLLSTSTNILAEASPFDSAWGIGLRADNPEARDPRRWRRKNCSEKLFLGFATPFAPMRPGWQPKPPLSNSSPGPRPAEFMRFPQSRLALGLWHTLAQVFLRSFRPVFLTRRRTEAPMSWLSRLGSTPPSRYQNMAPVSSAASLLSTMPLSPRRLRFTVALTPSRRMVAWRSSILVPHRISSDATYWIACFRWGQHPSRARGNTLLVPGVVLANLLLCKLGRACKNMVIVNSTMTPYFRDVACVHRLSFAAYDGIRICIM